MSSERFFVSDGLVLDREDACARLNGEELRLGAKALCILEALMSEPGRLVTKERLFEFAWPGQAVSDSVLTTAIKELRQAIGDKARQPEWIETAHGRGYRFLRDVSPSASDPGRKRLPEPADTETPPSPGRLDTRLRLALAGLAATVLAVVLIATATLRQPPAPETQQVSVQTQSVVVLPFEALDEEAERLARGLNAEILTTLTRTPDIQVAGSSVVNRVLDAGANADAEGRAAGFGHILQGVVRTDEQRIRVTTRLTDTATGRDIWSNRFDHPADDVIALQEDVAFQIARALDSVMDPQRLRAMAQIGTRSVEAYRAYRDGVELMTRAVTNSNPSLMDEARASYEEALRLDPNFARAHWRSAYMEFMTANTIYTSGGSGAWGEDARLKYIGHVEAAINAAPNETDRLLYRAAREVADLNYRQSVRLLERYLDERPRDTDVWYNILEHARIAERHDILERAILQLIELSKQGGYYPVIGSNYMDQNPELALLYARESMEHAPDYTALQFQAHRAFLIAGHQDEARNLLARMEAGQLPEPVRIGARIRQLCADGEAEEARNLARQLLANEQMPVVVRWSSAVTAGLEEDGYALLEPLDHAGNLLPLSQFLIYSEFDASRFAALSAALARAGIERDHTQRPVYACATSEDG